jgi:hypothetical protein
MLEMPKCREVVRSSDGILIAIGIAAAVTAVLVTGAMWGLIFGGFR